MSGRVEEMLSASERGSDTGSSVNSVARQAAHAGNGENGQSCDGC